MNTIQDVGPKEKKKKVRIKDEKLQKNITEQVKSTEGICQLVHTWHKSCC